MRSVLGPRTKAAGRRGTGGGAGIGTGVMDPEKAAEKWGGRKPEELRKKLDIC